jgi:alkylhydroperoxidase family enzyme
MNQDTCRPALLDPGDWPEALAPVLTELGNPLNIHNLMANHAALMNAWMPFRNHVVGNSTLEPRHRELLILRTAMNCDAEYEWAHHSERGRAAGLTNNEIQRVKESPESPPWTVAEKTLLKAADECFHNSVISDETYAMMKQCFDTPQQLDVLATIGMYITLATMIRTFRVPLED